jgi:hypothetical protein
MKQIVRIRLAHLSKGFGLGQLILVFEITDVDDHVKVVHVTLTGKHEINVWNVSWAFEELVEVSQFFLPELNERKLLEPDIVVRVCEEE